jgi:hypothetical protein
MSTTPAARSVHRLWPALALALACADDATGPQAVAVVDVSPTAITLASGQASALAGIPRDASGRTLGDRDVTWATDDALVATVDASGRVTGVSPGTTSISATSEGVEGSANVTVLPRPVSVIQVTPALVSLLPGDTLRLSAVARDARDSLVASAAYTWLSDDVHIASVDASGLVMGNAPGTATLFATVEGVSGSAAIDVVDPTAPRILAIDPAELVEGSPATLHGVNFDPLAAANVVTIAGVRANVAVATDTTLAIVVPTLGCRPRHLADIAITVASKTTRFAHPARPAAFFQPAVGQLTLLQNPAAYCLLFDATSADEEYLFGVQSTSSNASTVVSVLVVGDAADGAPASAPPTAATTVEAPLAQDADLPAMLAWRAREAEVMQREIEAVRDLPRTGTGPARAPRAPIPGNVTVGTQVTVRYPDLDSNNTCSNYIEIQGTVRYVTASGIWVSDNANPLDGFADAHYQTLGDRFESLIYPTQTGYFGAPADADGNARVVMVVTKEVNDDGIGGIVPSANLFPQGTCAGSNEGEYFFMLTADPIGVHAIGPLSVSIALSVAPSIIGHELVHNIHLSRRFEAGNTFWESWMHEGQATLGEEILGHAANSVIGRRPGQNYGWSVVRNVPSTADRAWYYDNIRPLFLYYGWSPLSGYDPQAPGANRRVGAPEACSWLDGPRGANAGVCAQRGFLVYGVTWTFLRWLADHYGPSFPGGESAMNRAWIDGAASGFASIETLVGEPIESLLARWAASLYLDDRVSGLDPLLTFPSYDLVDIEENVVPQARLAPRARGFQNFLDGVQVRAGSSAYFLMGGANRPSTAIRVRSSTGGLLDPTMQVWVVRTR